MSCTITAAATATVATALSIAITTVPDTQALIAPLINGNEYAVSTVSILASVPMLAVMSVLAISGRE